MEASALLLDRVEAASQILDPQSRMTRLRACGVHATGANPWPPFS
jgi:hypothetical protein